MDLSCFDLDNKLGYVANLEFVQWSPEKVLRTLGEIGYHAVSWRMSAFDPHTKGRQGLRDLDKLSRDFDMAISEANIQLDMVTHDPSERRERIEFLKECVLSERVRSSSERGGRDCDQDQHWAGPLEPSGSEDTGRYFRRRRLGIGG